MDGNQPGVQLIESEEDKKKKGQATQPGSAFSPTGQPASSAPSGTQQARAAQTAGSTRGTGFTGVGRFLQANVGSRLGEQVAGRVSQAGQQATSRLGQAVGQFGQQLGSQQQQLTQQQQAAQSALRRIAGSTSPSTSFSASKPSQEQRDFEASLPAMSQGLQQKYDAIYGDRLRGGPALTVEQQIQRIQRQKETFLSSLTPEERMEYDSRQYNPQKQVQLTPSQEEVAAYQAIAGGQIQAPTGLQDVEDVRAQAALAGQLAKGTQTATGRTGLLQQVVGRGPRQYTAGQSALDALILGQSGGQLAAARRASAGLGRQVETQSRLAEEQARQFGAEAQRTKAEITGTQKEMSKSLLSGIKTRASDFLTDRKKFQDDLVTALDKGELSLDQAKALGLSSDTTFFGTPDQRLSNLIESSISQSDVDPRSIASQEEAAKLNALAALSGESAFLTPDSGFKPGSLSDYKQGFKLKSTIPSVSTEAATERKRYLSSEINKILPWLVNDPWAEHIRRDVLRPGIAPGTYSLDSIQKLKDDLTSRIEGSSRVEPRVYDVLNQLNELLHSEKTIRIKR